MLFTCFFCDVEKTFSYRFHIVEYGCLSMMLRICLGFILILFEIHIFSSLNRGKITNIRLFDQIRSQAWIYWHASCSLFCEIDEMKLWSKFQVSPMYQTREKCPKVVNVFLSRHDGKNSLVPKMVTTTYNPGHNILELYNILVQIRFTTSKTKLDI